MSVQLCPVCEGKGKVPPGFYSENPDSFSTTSASWETCRACGGRGVIGDQGCGGWTSVGYAGEGVAFILTADNGTGHRRGEDP